MIKKQKSFYKTTETHVISWRLKQLKALQKSLFDYEDRLIEALAQDMGRSDFEVYVSELLIVKRSLTQAINKTRKWSKTKRKRQSVLLLGKKSYVTPRPRGVVLIISPFNYPIQLSLVPLITSLSSGNLATLKLSSKTPKTAKLLKEMLDNTFEDKVVQTFIGEKEITSQLLDEDFDLIFFTGSPQVGKIVMSHAAKHLTPVILELGGKSPAIVLKDADLKQTADRIVWGKFMNSGQTCVAPDYILVDEKIKQSLVHHVIQSIRSFYGEFPLDSKDYGHMIDQKSLDRQIALLQGQEIIHGGLVEGLRLEPTLILDPSMESDIMNEEIFGPILPIIGFTTMNDVYKIVDVNPNPLALYVFSKDRRQVKNIMTKIPFGGGMMNDTVLHLANEWIPFGGIKQSGMSMYHGKEGFNNFSHQQSYVESSRLVIPFLYPPYADRLRWFKKYFK
ncbi:aldehyde dehydrogenase family protein [Erysipelothrix urinaevulpis]|uniref:aldehyde dehydrogenase family protein n=1 Tax=Erysipelothrix urinaevulpis TaxID=2683717 RepID=UPI0013572A1B|nr:aldehyde dehydrogenase family protein [Erysipelothrix urinaevulpis]